MQRWNDHIRLVELNELDKQAHKMVIAYVIAKFEEERLGPGNIDWIKLIEGGLFEFLHRLVLTDIKPPVFHKMMAEKGDEVNNHVFHDLNSDLNGLGDEDFKTRFKNYFIRPENTIERRILRAAHYLATNWEFKIIYNAAPFIYGIEKTKESIENQIEDHYDLIGVQKILLGKKSFGFIDLCGQLRFQKRWAHTPRIPETSVLGHMLIVAATSYLGTLEMGIEPCTKRLYNNFFAGLFHDIPEILTKDIISPIKRSVAGLEDIIKDYEDYQMKAELLPLLPKTWHEEMIYFTHGEFLNKRKENGEINAGISFQDMNKKYNQNQYSPMDGELIKGFDQLSAYIEAKLSIQYGVTSDPIREAETNIYNNMKDVKVSGVDLGRIFHYFYEI